MFWRRRWALSRECWAENGGHKRNGAESAWGVQEGGCQAQLGGCGGPGRPREPPQGQRQCGVDSPPLGPRVFLRVAVPAASHCRSHRVGEMRPSDAPLRSQGIERQEGF